MVSSLSFKDSTNRLCSSRIASISLSNVTRSVSFISKSVFFVSNASEYILRASSFASFTSRFSRSFYSQSVLSHKRDAQIDSPLSVPSSIGTKGGGPRQLCSVGSESLQATFLPRSPSRRSPFAEAPTATKPQESHWGQGHLELVIT